MLYLRADAAMAFEACKLVMLKEQRGDEVRDALRCRMRCICPSCRCPSLLTFMHALPVGAADPDAAEG